MHDVADVTQRVRWLDAHLPVTNVVVSASPTNHDSPVTCTLPSQTEPPQHHASRPVRTILICTLLLCTFATLSWTASLGKSPTMDEPYHAMAGWMRLWHSDYRIDSEDPPLWNMIAAAANPPGSLKVDLAALDPGNVPADTSTGYLLAMKTLFRTPGNNATAFIRRARAVMLGWGVVLGALIATMAWKMARDLGASHSAACAGSIFATAIYTFDPNFLAHASLVKNDVASALVLLMLVFTTWRVGQSMSVRNIAALASLAGLALLVKFNGPLLIFIAILLLLIRACLSFSWNVPGAKLNGRIQRLAVAVVVAALLALAGFVSVWLAYGLRFAPALSANAKMDMPSELQTVLLHVWQSDHLDDASDIAEPTNAQLAATPLPPLVWITMWAERWHLLPQSFLAGLLYVFDTEHLRPTYIYGQTTSSNVWWYFPVAIAVKTPLATLALFIWMIVSFLASCIKKRRGAGEEGQASGSFSRWTWMCLVIPVLAYLAAAMIQNLHLGVRHVLPLYPPLFVAAGLSLARLWGSRKKLAILCGLPIILLLATESCWSYPDYLPFFNLAVGGSRGGLQWLSDSNLDWGQDLPLLAAWQRAHPAEKLYLAYFGVADPAFYGIHYTNVACGYWQGPPAQDIKAPGVLAISATILQGPYCQRPNGGPAWSILWRFRPFQVLGGSIYLFHVPPLPKDNLPFGQMLIEN